MKRARTVRIAAVLAFAVGATSALAVDPSPPALDSIPVERAIRHLEELAPAGSVSAKNARRLALARLHVLAYTHPDQPIGVRKGTEEEYAWPYATGVEHLHPIDHPPGKREHLARALELYREAVKAEPKNGVARIGYAFTRDQSGRHAEALREYRALYRESYALLKHPDPKNLGAYDVGAEAATYLVTLLDPKKDAAEIKRVQDGQNELYTAESRFRWRREGK